MRFSIHGLLALVAVAAAACVALMHASELSKQVSYTLAFVLLWLGVVAGLCHNYPKRAFWIGFSVCGLAFFYLGAREDSSLVTRQLSSYVYNQFQDAIQTSPEDKAAPAFYYRHVFHSFASLAFAYVGGFIGSFIYSRRQKPTVEG